MKRLLIALLILTAALPVMAQETAGPAAEAAAVPGPSSPATLMLIIGLGAIAAVGGMMLLRENAHHEVD